MSSIPIPRSSSRRTASAIAPAGSGAARAAPSSSREGDRPAIAASAATRPPQLAGVLQAHLEPVAADAPLQLVGGAFRDQEAVVDDRDPIREAVGLVQVLGGEEHGRPLRRQRLDRLPERDAAGEVEAGRRLVEEEDGRARDERGGEVEAAAHAARVGAHEPAAGVGQDRSSRAARRPRSRERRRPRW